ncbi:hypothetical protein LCGC14_1578160 [marine sediment metagenome]|uniref:Uncharacterized protein n=1 Tax=marine sediment metagenome TaxID=412755 RepID=A0A0F9IHP5_9ZZZZ
MITATSIKQTLKAWPSEWEGIGISGHSFYIRYRHGILTLHSSKIPSTDVWDAVDGKWIAQIEVTKENDGIMSTVKMLHHLQPYLKLAKGVSL